MQSENTAVGTLLRKIEYSEHQYASMDLAIQRVPRLQRGVAQAEIGSLN